MLNLTEVQYIQMEYQNSKGEKSAYLVDVLKNPFECIGIDIETSKVIPYFWLPKWCGDIKEPSARVLQVYKEDGVIEEL